MKRKHTSSSPVNNKKIKLQINLINIFKDTLLFYLSGHEIVKCSLVSKDWHEEIYKNENLWKRVIVNECGYIKKLSDYADITTFFDLYKYFYKNTILKIYENPKDSNIEGSYF